MQIDNIIKEIENLSVEERLMLIEKAAKSLQSSKFKNLQQAVNVLYDDYKNDKELTIFTNLDFENFYETR